MQSIAISGHADMQLFKIEKLHKRLLDSGM